MTITMMVGKPIVMCNACYDVVGSAGMVLYPEPNGRSHFPEVRAYCDEACLRNGERGSVGPTVTVGWDTFLKDLSRVG